LDSAETLGIVSTIAFPIGLGALGVGLGLLFTEPKKTDTQPKKTDAPVTLDDPYGGLKPRVVGEMKKTEDAGARRWIAVGPMGLGPEGAMFGARGVW
jgi:hypothetical protein